MVQLIANLQKKIDVSNAIFIKMPRYDEVVRRLTSKKQKSLTMKMLRIKKNYMRN